MKSFILVFCALVLFPIFICGVSLPDVLKRAHFGVLVKDLNSGEVLNAYQSEKSFSPASLTKLITTATVLEKLSPDFRYVTSLSYSGSIDNGVLCGDLYIVGSGDPTFCSDSFYANPDSIFSAWANEISRCGITKIKGCVIADASVFDGQIIPDKWLWEDIGNYYGAACCGLSFRDNKYDLTLKSGGVGEPVSVVGVQPFLPGLTFDCFLTGADNNRDNAYIYGSPHHFKKQIYGTIPKNREAFVIKGAMPEPSLMTVMLFTHKLNAMGIEVAEKPVLSLSKEAKSLSHVATCYSPTLSQIIKVTNKESNNLFAEHLLKTLDVGDDAAVLTQAIDTLMSFWASRGVDVDGVRLYDGSGLSRANMVTPHFMVSLLEAMKLSKNNNSFFQSLAISGVDGTFRYFLDDALLKGKVYGKSGSMSGVRCYAGYAYPDSGKAYVFCIMVNNSTASMTDIRTAIEAYLLQVIS